MKFHSREFYSEEWKTKEIPGNTQQGYEKVFQMGQIGEQIVNKNLTLLSLYANNLARDEG
jgi:hypothetical protein